MKIANTAAVSAFLFAAVTAPLSNAFVPIASVRSTNKKAFVSSADKYSLLLRSTIEEEQSIVNSYDSLNGVPAEGIIGISKDDDNSATQKQPIKIGPTASEVQKSTNEYLKQFIGQSGAAAVYSKLVENGVTVVNGYSGGAVLPLLDQFHNDNPRHDDTTVGGTQKQRSPIRWITNSNENSAGHIAEGFAKAYPIIDGKIPVGVCVATSGPGVTNLITPLQDAMCDGVPILVLCGQAATVAPPDAFQQAPAVALTKPCTKWSYQIKSAAEVPLVMDYAFYLATHGRPGPVFIDLPKDLQNQIITEELINDFVENTLPGESEDGFARLVQKQRSNGNTFTAIHMGHDNKRGLSFEIHDDHKKIVPVTDTDDLTDTHHADHNAQGKIYADAGVDVKIKEGSLASLDDPVLEKLQSYIMQAKQPIIIAGQGCNDCPQELKEFAERLQIPVTTTLHALGSFDERHPLACNMMGMHGHAAPNFLVQEADLILCIGSRFDDRITGRMSDFAGKARLAASEKRGGIVHVDIRLTEKSKQVSPTFFVHSTGKEFLRTMNKAFSKKVNLMPKTAAWLRQKAKLQQEFPIPMPHYKAKEVTKEDGSIIRKTRMSAQSVVKKLDEVLCRTNVIDNTIITTGVGIHQMVAAQLITWTQPRQMLSSGSLGTMGVSTGYVVGAKLACKDKICISIDGDGSFNMTFTELKTIAEQKIPVKLMILDNEAQMMVEYWQRLFHDKRLLAVRNSNNPDYRVLASAFGIKSLYVDCEEDLESVLNEFLFADPEEPVLLHVSIERTPCLPMVAPGQPLHDMILEDVDFDVEEGAAPS